MAVCVVEGGPEYELKMIGDSSYIDYKVSTNLISFGEVPFNEVVVSEFLVENTSKVSFNFNISLSSLTRPGIIEVHPGQGKISAQEKVKVQVKLFAGIPDFISEFFLVEVAHFAPVGIKVQAYGVYPGFVL